MKTNFETKKLNILIVEDESTFLNSMSFMLSRVFGKVFKAINGEEALKLYLEKKKDIDLILTDLRMPSMNGFELINEIKKIEKNLPIYVISGDINLKEQTNSLGIKNFFNKPLILPDLVNRIEKDLIK